MAPLAFAMVLSGMLACGTTPAPRPSEARTGAPTSPAPAFPPETYEPPAVPTAELRRLVAYDADRPLAVTTNRTTKETRRGVAVTDLTFDDGFGAPVEAYLVTPLRPPAPRLAGVVFAHGSGRDRSRFLDEAKALATRGAVVLLPTVPMTISGTAAADLDHLRRAVITQRRAVDVLAARDDVDPRRLAFAGHSWGGVLASIMSGAEPRLAAVVVASFTKRLTRYIGGRQDYIDQVTAFDQHRWLALPGQRRILLQAGTYDSFHPRAGTDELFALTAGPKERRDYDLGHDLVTPVEPVNDRRAFLARVLGLARG